MSKLNAKPRFSLRLMYDTGQWEEVDVGSRIVVEDEAFLCNWNEQTETMTLHKQVRAFVPSVAEAYHAHRQMDKRADERAEQFAEPFAEPESPQSSPAEKQDTPPVGTGTLSTTIQIRLGKLCKVTLQEGQEVVFHLRDQDEQIENARVETHFHPDDPRVQIPNGEAPESLEFVSTASLRRAPRYIPSCKRQRGDE